MQIPLRFVFVYSFRLYDQNYTTIPSFFSELIGYLSKIICYGDISVSYTHLRAHET